MGKEWIVNLHWHAILNGDTNRQRVSCLKEPWVILQASRKQGYIFACKKLRENAQRSTGEWYREATGVISTLSDGRQEQEFWFVHTVCQQICRLELEKRILSGCTAF